MILEQNLSNLPNGLDPSPVLNSTPSGNGRFENGNIDIGPAPPREPFAVEANGDIYVQNTVAPIRPSFTLTQPGGGASLVGSVRGFVLDTVFFLNLPPGTVTTAFVGQTFTVAGAGRVVTSVPQNNVVVVDRRVIPACQLTDDDREPMPHDISNATILALYQPDMERIFGEAFFLPEFDGGASAADNQINLPFRLNLVPRTGTTVREQIDMGFGSGSVRKPDYWIVYVQFNYQPHPFDIIVPTDVRGDADPDFRTTAPPPVGESPLEGVGDALPATGSLLFVETLRETAAGVQFVWGQVMVHEIGHQFSLPNQNPGRGIMSADLRLRRVGFNNDDLHTIRSHVAGPGFPLR